MVDRNVYLKVLEDKVQQDDVYQAVQAKSKWIDMFVSNQVQIYAFGARYVVTQPKEGLN